jgi:transcriptional regulator with XRE-family HTH domain
MTKNNHNQDPKCTSAARGKRLKTVRVMAGLTRNSLEKKYGISASTMQSWEAAKAGGLTERGLKRIIPILKEEGVFCSEDWLYYGIGKPPHPTVFSAPQAQEDETRHPADSEDKIIIQELLTFRKLNRNVIDHIVNDDGMAPHYAPNDYVAGRRRRGSDVDALLNQPCIVETTDNEIMLRLIKRGSMPGRYTLMCTNLNSSIDKPTLYEQRLLSAAPIIWHRRRDTKAE